MSVKKEAGEILIYIYNNRNNDISSFKIAEDTKKDIKTINEAIKYLEQKYMIKVGSQRANGNRCSIKIEADGIDTIEDNSEFERTFSFGVNLGLFNASWSVTKKK